MRSNVVLRKSDLKRELKGSSWYRLETKWKAVRRRIQNTERREKMVKLRVPMVGSIWTVDGPTFKVRVSKRST